MPESVLSVVVIGRNEGLRLARCLESIRDMRCPGGQVELIYVDSGSHDGSVQRAAGYGAKVIELCGGKLSAARARNAGWQAASAPFVFFLDGDTIVDRDFVERALPEFKNPRVMVVTGHRREIRPEASIYNRVLDLDWLSKPGFTEYCGGDAIMRRTALQQTGGFNASLIAGEEPDLCWRIRSNGGLILHIDAAMTGHDLVMVNWRQYCRRAIRTGHAYAEIAGLYERTADPLWSHASRHNAIHGSVYMLAPIVAVSIAILDRSWASVLFLLFGAVALILRTALRARGRRTSLSTLILFAIHSHVQQVPILLGQVRQWLNSRQGQKSTLIEYKNG
jgi:cellulose synthase/poly-beta-1,6-N-acetylglucosamine synthase-like glycosyltransferase